MMYLLIVLLAVFHVTMIDYLTNNPNYYQLNAYTWESDDFRAMKLGEWLASQSEPDYDTLTSLLIEHEYDLTKLEKASPPNERLMAVKPVEYKKLRNAYKTVLQDMRYFPVPNTALAGAVPITYANGWMDTRTYGGERGHEGCDIMGNQKERGYYPVVSMTDGVIEKIGWLEKGGWRIGIRSPGGLYLYYAHLYNYSKQWQEGDVVSAGQLLGFMGDSGYSAVEGTVGNFDVHLHVGIYLRTDHQEEMSINPYWILKYLEKNRLTYSY